MSRRCRRKPGERINGIPIYDVKPLLVVTGENVQVQIVPNYNRPYALRFGAFLAKNNVDVSMQNGILTTVKADMDSTEFIKLLTALVNKLPDAKGFSDTQPRTLPPAASKTASRSTTSSSTTRAILSDCGRCSTRPTSWASRLQHRTVVPPPSQAEQGGAGGSGIRTGPIPGQG